MNARWFRWFAGAGIALVAFSGTASTTTSYGKALSGASPVRISDLVRSPEQYLGKTVRVEGLVQDICPMKGCWIDILERQGHETIRFQVPDGVIVFPVEARGREVVAEGVLHKREMSKRQATSWLRHLAEEKGEPFDASSVTGPMVFYQLRGLGAEVSGE